MKKFLPAVFCLLVSTAIAQEFVQVSYSNSYAQHAFYRLSDDGTVNIGNTAWDLAFTTTGSGVAGIHLNETAIVFGDEAVLYLAPTDNFNDTIDPADLTERLLNDEQSWEFGAFNSPGDPGDLNDYGWGLLDPGTGVITGNRVFVLRFKSGTLRKILIESLDQGVYTVKHADLDGGGEATLTVDQANFTGQGLAFVNLGSGAALNNIPAGWDLLFIRYSSPFDDGAGGQINIMTSGVLSAPGVEVAEARGIVPQEVTWEEYEDSLSAAIDVIGSDWKAFDNISWSIAEDLAFFVKRPDGSVWKLIFVSFGGSSSGNVVFSKEEIVTSSVSEGSLFRSYSVYPNPAGAETTLVFSLKQAAEARLSLRNHLGQTMWTSAVDAREGLNAVNIPLDCVQSGSYFLSVQLGREVRTEHLVKY